MNRPMTPYVDWQWEWRETNEQEEGQRFHVPHFESTRRGWGHGGRALVKVAEFAVVEKGATEFSIQMGGGAPSARWLDSMEGEFRHCLRVEDVQGYAGEDWRAPEQERVDGEDDTEGDEQSSVYATIVDLEYLAWEKGWMTEEELGWE